MAYVYCVMYREKGLNVIETRLTRSTRIVREHRPSNAIVVRGRSEMMVHRIIIIINITLGVLLYVGGWMVGGARLSQQQLISRFFKNSVGVIYIVI